MHEISLENIAPRALQSLEWRLQRLEFLLKGSDQSSTKQKAEGKDNSIPVTQRLRKLEQSLQKLASKSPIVSELLKLQTRHAHLFKPMSTSSEAITAVEAAPTSVPAMPTDQKLSTIIAHSPMIQAAASQLRSLQPVPATSTFTQIISLAPRIKAVHARQIELELEISALRAASAQAVLRWQEVFVSGVGRCWVEWESRVKEVEREIGRRERRKEIEDKS